MTVEQAVVFAILIQANNGILNTSPDYIKTQLALCEDIGFVEQALNPFNVLIYEEWVRRWAKVEGTS